MASLRLTIAEPDAYLLVISIGSRMNTLFNLETSLVFKSHSAEFEEDQFPLLHEFKLPADPSHLRVEFLDHEIDHDLESDDDT